MPIFLDIDGNFPNHPPDPSNKNNLKDLINLVQKNKLDFGVAFDGDADRAVFIDNKGKSYIWKYDDNFYIRLFMLKKSSN